MPSPTVTTGWVRLTLCFEAHPGMGRRQGWGGDSAGLPCQGSRLPIAFSSLSQDSAPSIRKRDSNCFVH